MFKSRMLDAIKQSRYIPPIWLAILIAIGFVYGGRFAGMFGMFPIGLVIGILFRATNPAGGQAALMEFFRHYSLFFELFTFFLSLLLSSSGFDIVRSVLFLVWDFINKTGSKIYLKASLLEPFSFHWLLSCSW